MVLTYYFDLLSQPSRSVWMFLKYNGVEFTEKRLDLSKGETRTPEYLKINPLHTVPYVVFDKDLKMGESVATMRYIAETNNLPDNWFGKTKSKESALIGEFNDWHHNGLRKPLVSLFLPVFMSRHVEGGFPFQGKLDTGSKEFKALTDGVENSFKHVETYVLKGKKDKFLVGDEISVADLVAFNEIRQLYIIGYEKLLEDNKVVFSWYTKVEGKMKAFVPDAMVRCEQMKKNFQAAKTETPPASKAAPAKKAPAAKK